MSYLWISLGAALGGSARYWITGLVQNRLEWIFPLGTLAVNFAGSFLLGLFVFFMQSSGWATREARLLFSVGFCGALTTYSTFSYETLELFRDSEFLLGSLNIVGNVVLTLLGVYLAFLLSRWIGHS